MGRRPPETTGDRTRQCPCREVRAIPTWVVIAGDTKKALVKGKKDSIFLREGEEIDGYKVVGIEPKGVRMSLNGREFAIGLYKDLFGISGPGRTRGDEETEEIEFTDRLADWADFPELYELEDKYK